MYKWPPFWIALSALAVWCQNDMTANVNLQFQFRNPGARSMAMGGAFVGMADDPSALLANPAGLSQLSQRSVVLEGLRQERDYDIPFFGGSIVQEGLTDLQFDLTSRAFPEAENQIPFFGAIFPATHTPSASWGFFYGVQAKMSRSFQTESILVPAAPFYWRPVNVATNFYFYPTDNHLQLTQELFGLSGGKAITDSFSLGASIVAERQRYQGHTTLFLPHFQEAQLAFLQPLFGQALAEIAVDGDDWQPALFLGALWTPNEAFQLGLSLQHHGRFSYDYTVSERTLDVTTVTLGPYEEIQAGTASFSMPDHLSLGFRYRIGEAFMVAGELAMSRTSELTRSMVYFFNQQGNELKAKDTLELRMGAEYTWFQWSYPFSIRAGYRFEPYHAATNTLQDEELLFRDDQGNQGVRNSVFLNRFEQDLNHVSCGMGWILSRQWQVDMAGVWSETGADYALSMLYRY